MTSMPGMVWNVRWNGCCGKSKAVLLGNRIYFAFRSSKWYARPVTLRNPALI